MRHSPYLLAAMLAAFLLAGCTEEIITTPDQSAYRQDTTTSSYSNVPASSNGIYNPYTGIATTSQTATTSTTPTAGALVQAQVTASTPRGLFKKTLEVTVQVSNKDTVEHSGYLVVTFTDAAGKTELAYRYVTIAPNGLQSVTVSSTNPASSGSVVFKERFL